MNSWDGGYNASVRVENTSDEIIHNWYLAYDENYDIKNIWNAEVYDNNDGLTVIKNAGWNQDILPGVIVEFGFTGKGEFCGYPTKYELATNNVEVDLETYSVEYVINSDWNSGFTGSIVIINNSNEVLEDWTLEFDFERTINSVWDGEIITNVSNGVISLIEMDMADGDSSLDDFGDGHFYIKPKLELKFDSQQLGGKWGKHRYDYPELTSYKEYEQLARTVFNNPDKIVFCGSNQEYLYIRGNELLRVTFNGEFVSMYPGSNTDLVKKALEAGGLLWER